MRCAGAQKHGHHQKMALGKIENLRGLINNDDTQGDDRVNSAQEDSGKGEIKQEIQGVLLFPVKDSHGALYY